MTVEVKSTESSGQAVRLAGLLLRCTRLYYGVLCCILTLLASIREKSRRGREGRVHGVHEASAGPYVDIGASSCQAITALVLMDKARHHTPNKKWK